MDKKRFKIFESRSISPTLLIVYVLLIALFSILNPLYISVENLKGILAYLTISGILAAGLSTVIIAGNLDLSIGSIVGISAIICAKLNIIEEGTFPVWAIIIIAIAAGALIGALNGFLSSYVGLNSLIVTLGTLAIFRGLSYVFATDITRINNKFFLSIGRHYIFSIIPITMIYFAIIILFIYLMLRFTKFGRNIYIIGSNSDAANAAGIPTKKVKFFTFIISGVTAALGGIILSSQLGMAHGEFGSGYEFQILTICILGGISLSGGRGTVVGVLIATLILGSISNGLALSNVSKTWLDAIYGAILIIAIMIDSLRINKRKVVLNE